jgi:hypothetical protein
MPTGDCGEGTGPAVTALARLLLGNAFAVDRRCAVYLTLVEDASGHVEEPIRNAELSRSSNWLPRTRQWAEQVRHTVSLGVR